MKYRHQFRVSASVERVAEFHALSASMAAITPPLIVVKMQHAPAVLADGDDIDFTMWLGPLPVGWLARMALREMGVRETVFTPESHALEGKHA